MSTVLKAIHCFKLLSEFGTGTRRAFNFCLALSFLYVLSRRSRITRSVVGLYHVEHSGHGGGRAQLLSALARRATAHFQTERARLQLQFALLVKE